MSEPWWSCDQHQQAWAKGSAMPVSCVFCPRQQVVVTPVELWVTHRSAMLDVWLALGGDGPTFETWMVDRPSADAWAQLLAAIRGDLMPGDTNPEPGLILVLVERRLLGR